MSNTYCYDVYPRTNDNLIRMARYLVDRHGFSEKSNQYGTYFHIEVDGMDTAYVSRILKRRNYKYRKYEKRWERDANYRDNFFAHNRGPYHCAYCGKRLRAKDIEVDHLIPVSQTKKGYWARFLLWANMIGNVNDHRNLVASCHKCNQKKSDKMGLWVLRGTLGRTNWYWPVRNFIVTAFILLIVYIVLCSLSVIPDNLNILPF